MATHRASNAYYGSTKHVASATVVTKSAFERLPDEIIEQILFLTTPNVFASLVLLNNKWRAISQQAHLYAHQLSQCSSYAAAHHTIPIADTETNLPRLRRLFAQEIKRNLYEAYLRPRETIISLVSTSISSSSAPGGEAFHFSISPRGYYVLACSSSRIHVIDVHSKEVAVKRELKILRRPASATITDNGALLAVLSTDMQIDLYDLTEEHPRHTQAIALDHTPRTITLSPTGTVLAAAYDSGVEVSSLDPNFTNTDRRSVKCYAVDSLSFSRDGTQLLGTSIQSRNPSTVVLTAPYYDPGANSPEETVSALWTTSILFPNGSRDCSHAVLLPGLPEEEASWTFTYDRIFETFRAVRIEDLRNGTTYFTGPTADTSSKLLPSTLPAATHSGDLVAAGFQGAIWLYGVPEDLDALPVINSVAYSNTESEASTPTSQLGRRNSAPSPRSPPWPRENALRVPQWQLLCDKTRNTFIEGRKVSSLDRVSAMNWVGDIKGSSSLEERLVAVAPGVSNQSIILEDDVMSPVDGGRISILDFDFSVIDGVQDVITIEVGINQPQTLEEEHRDLDTEVAIMRRRTVAQRREIQGQVIRSATTASRLTHHEPPPPLPLPSMLGIRDHYAPSESPIRNPSQSANSTEQSEMSVDEQEAFDAPYSHTSPRSGTTLRRAATAAAVNRRLNPRAVAQEHIEYRRADGREDHPHESDADNWVPPPPPYSKDPVPQLPEHIQRSLLAETTAAGLQRSNTQRAPSIDFPGLDNGTLSRSRTIASTSTASSWRDRRYSFERTLSDTTSRTLDRVSLSDDDARPTVNPVSAFDDLYDVSPPGSPQAGSPQLSPQSAELVPLSEPSPGTPPHGNSPVSPLTSDSPPTIRSASNQIPRRPVGTNNRPNAPPPTPNSNMEARLQQPISPIPQPNLPPNENIDRRLLEWEKPPADQDTAINASPKSHSPAVASMSEDSFIAEHPAHRASNHTIVEADVSTQPNESHHLTELTPTTSASPNQQRFSDSRVWPLPIRTETLPVPSSHPGNTDGEPLPMWRRTGSAPAFSTTKNEPKSQGVSMPSSDQLARLSSRRGRPAGAADPRRLSGSSSQNPRLSGTSFLNINSRASPQRPLSQGMTPEQSFNTTQFRNSKGFPQTPSTVQSIKSPHAAHSQSPSRRMSSAPSPPRNGYRRSSPSNGHQRHLYNNGYSQQTISDYSHETSNISPGPRPTLDRMETIHSIGSQGTASEPSPYFAQRQIMIARQSSRAERSAAKNIQDAKKRGWRASLKGDKKKPKEKYGDGASSAGWTDVTADSSGPAGRSDRRDKEKSGKCTVM